MGNKKYAKFSRGEVSGNLFEEQMGVALYIALKKDIPGTDTMIDGKMLGRAEKSLADAAQRLGVRPLTDFLSTSADEAADLLGEDMPGATKWFSAEEGLRTVDALLADIDTSAELRAAKDDLLGCRRVLREALKHGASWHLAIDF